MDKNTEKQAELWKILSNFLRPVYGILHWLVTQNSSEMTEDHWSNYAKPKEHTIVHPGRIQERQKRETDTGKQDCYNLVC